jgi:hypothetical protein
LNLFRHFAGDYGSRQAVAVAKKSFRILTNLEDWRHI